MMWSILMSAPENRHCFNRMYYDNDTKQLLWSGITNNRTQTILPTWKLYQQHQQQYTTTTTKQNKIATIIKNKMFLLRFINYLRTYSFNIWEFSHLIYISLDIKSGVFHDPHFPFISTTTTTLYAKWLKITVLHQPTFTLRVLATLLSWSFYWWQKKMRKKNEQKHSLFAIPQRKESSSFCQHVKQIYRGCSSDCVVNKI